MRMIHSLSMEDHSLPVDATSEGQLLIRLFPDRLEILPLLDRLQAARSYARLQALVTDWAESPALLAQICEVEVPSNRRSHRRKSWTITLEKLRHSWNERRRAVAMLHHFQSAQPTRLWSFLAIEPDWAQRDEAPVPQPESGHPTPSACIEGPGVVYLSSCVAS
jgi:hypothetical protein